MGCLKSKVRIIKADDGELYNVNSNTKKRLVAGLHLSKTKDDGIGGDVQMGYVTTIVKTYTKVGEEGNVVRRKSITHHKIIPEDEDDPETTEEIKNEAKREEQ